MPGTADDFGPPLLQDVSRARPDAAPHFLAQMARARVAPAFSSVEKQ